MLALTAWTTLSLGGSTPAGAATAAEPSRSRRRREAARPTSASISRPSAACTGDSAGGNYRVQTYLIPAAADPASLTFDGSGPIAVSGEFRSPLYSSNGDPVVAALTGSASTPGGPGLISGLPTLNFAVFLPGESRPATYNVGVACTVGGAGPSQLDKYWNTGITVTADAGDAPAGFTWVAAAPTATTTTTAGGTTTTTAGGTTTTTGDGDDHDDRRSARPRPPTAATTTTGGGERLQRRLARRPPRR